MKVNSLEKTDLPSQLINSIKKSLSELYGEQLNKVVIFGSYARGDARFDSDIDLMIVLNKENISVSKEIDSINEHLYPLNLVYDKFISVMPVSITRYTKQSDNPLYKNVKKEGIIL